MMFAKKDMKKIIAMLLALVMVVGLVACGNKTPDATKPSTEPAATTAPAEGDATTAPAEDEATDATVAPVEDFGDIMVLTDTEYRLLTLHDAMGIQFNVMTWALTIDDAEMIKAYTGLDDMTKIVEASVTEPAMSSQAYSVVLVKVADGIDAAAVAEEMKAGVDPRKWVCVEADEIETAVIDNYVLLVMMASDLSEEISAKSAVDAYVALAKDYVSPETLADAPTLSDIIPPVVEDAVEAEGEETEADETFTDEAENEHYAEDEVAETTEAAEDAE